MKGFTRLVGSGGTGRPHRRPLSPSIERLETRELLSQSPFSSLIFQRLRQRTRHWFPEPFPTSFPRMCLAGSRAFTSLA